MTIRQHVRNIREVMERAEAVVPTKLLVDLMALEIGQLNHNSPNVTIGDNTCKVILILATGETITIDMGGYPTPPHTYVSRNAWFNIVLDNAPEQINFTDSEKLVVRKALAELAARIANKKEIDSEAENQRRALAIIEKML